MSVLFFSRFGELFYFFLHLCEKLISYVAGKYCVHSRHFVTIIWNFPLLQEIGYLLSRQSEI